MTEMRAAAAGRLFKIALGNSDPTLTAFRQALADRGLTYDRAPWGDEIPPEDIPTIAAAFHQAVLPDIGGPDRDLAVQLLARIET